MAIAYAKQLQNIVTAYREAGQSWPASKHDIAEWAFRQELWRPRRGDMVSMFADQLAEAMREEFYTDPQGRGVRTKHVAQVDRNGKQMHLWGDIRTEGRPFMVIAFQQRRVRIVGDCKQLKTDVDSYNDNRNPGPAIQLSLDFTRDVAEVEAVDLLTQRIQTAEPQPSSSRS